MSMLLSKDVSVGTSRDALAFHEKKRQRSAALRRRLGPNATDTTTLRAAKPFYSQDDNHALLIHSPHRASGKTLLIRSIAEDLGCVVYRIEYAKLIAAFGIHADSGLECLLHSLVLQTAVRNQKICIILDHFDSFVPSFTAGQKYDATLPILNAIGE